MPGGIDTGVRARVIVLPDTSKFVPDLKKYIKRIEHSLKIEIPTTIDPSGIDEKLARVRQQQQRNPVKVPLQAQADEFTRQARAAAQKAARSVQADIPLTADGEALRRDLARQVESLERLTSLTVPLDLGMAAKFRADVLAQVEAIQRIADSAMKANPAELPVEAKLTDFAKQVRSKVAQLQKSTELQIPATVAGEKMRAELARKVAEVERLSKIEVPVNLKDAAKLHADVLKAVAEVEALAKAADPTVTVKTKLDRSNALGGMYSLLALVQKRALAVGAALLKWSGGLAAAASTAALVAPYIIAAGTAVLKYGNAAVAASPMLLAFAAAGGIVLATLKAITPDLGKALKPIGDSFSKMGEQAASAAVKGVRPLAKSFADAAFPVISPAITRIGKATNGVVKSFLEWGQSTAGLKAIKSVVNSTASAYEKVAPAVERFAESLGLMLGRIAGVSLKAGSNGLVGFLDRLRKAMDGVDAKSVRRGLDTLIEGANKAKNAVLRLTSAIGAGVAFYEKYKQQIHLAADALAVFAIAFGGPVTAAVAAAGLIIRHFDTIKTAISGVGGSLSGFGASMTASFNTVKPAVQGFVSAVLPPLQNIGRQATAVLGPALARIGEIIQTQVAPAFASLLVAVTPVVTFLIQKFGVVFIAVLKTLAAVVQAAFTVIAGIFNVFAGLLTGNWDQLWKGIKQIVSGVWAAIKAVVTNGWTVIKTAFSTAGAVLKAITSRIWDAITTAVGNAWKAIKAAASAGWNGVKSGVSAAWNFVKDKTSAAWSAVSSATSTAWAAVKSKVSSAVGSVLAAVRDKLGQVIDYVKGFPARVKGGLGNLGSLLYSAGADIVRGMINGLKSMAGALASAAGAMASNAVSAVKSKLHINSPSKVMITLGRYVAQGFAIGILGDADKVRAAGVALTQKIQDAVAAYRKSKASIADKISADAIAVKKARIRYEEALKQHGKGAAAAVKQAGLSLKSATARLAKDRDAATALAASSGSLGKLSKAGLAALSALIKTQTNRLAALAKAREKVAARLEAARGKLDEAIRLRDDYAKSVADQARAFGSIIAQGVEGRALSASDVVAQLRAKLDALTAFRQNLERLRAAGLSDAALKQLVDAGVEAGSATAAALASGGQEAVAQVNALTSAIGSQADALGTSAAAQFYQAGVDAAKGLVAGLAAQQAAIDAAAAKIAAGLVKSVKKTLGIKSPSTVMASLGVFIGQGLAQGIEASRSLVERATDRLSAAATPVSAAFEGAGPGGVGSGGVNVTVNNPTPETASESTTRIMRRLALLGPA